MWFTPDLQGNENHGVKHGTVFAIDSEVPLSSWVWGLAQVSVFSVFREVIQKVIFLSCQFGRDCRGLLYFLATTGCGFLPSSVGQIFHRKFSATSGAKVIVSFPLVFTLCHIVGFILLLYKSKIYYSITSCFVTYGVKRGGWKGFELIFLFSPLDEHEDESVCVGERDREKERERICIFYEMLYLLTGMKTGELL